MYGCRNAEKIRLNALDDDVRYTVHTSLYMYCLYFDSNDNNTYAYIAIQHPHGVTHRRFSIRTRRGLVDVV